MTFLFLNNMFVIKLLKARPFLFLIVLVAAVFFAGCGKDEGNRDDQSVDILYGVYSGENYVSSDLRFSDGSGFVIPHEAEAWTVCELPLEGSGRAVDTNVLPLRSSVFWHPDPVSDERIQELMRVYEDEVGSKMMKGNTSKQSSYSSLLMCQGGIRIYSDQVAFGEKPGTDLSSHFFVHDGNPYRLYGKELTVVNNSDTQSAVSFFGAGMMLCPFFVLFTKDHPGDGPLTVRIELPVDRVLYLSYLRDRLSGKEALLEFSPLVLSGSVRLVSAR